LIEPCLGSHTHSLFLVLFVSYFLRLSIAEDGVVGGAGPTPQQAEEVRSSSLSRWLRSRSLEAVAREDDAVAWVLLADAFVDRIIAPGAAPPGERLLVLPIEVIPVPAVRPKPLGARRGSKP
jgi:hypothetical protein